MKRRIFSALAALALLFCSCAASDADNTKEQYENVGPSSSAPDTPSANYSSYEFKILTSYATDAKNIGIFEGERNSAKINEETAKRSSSVEKSFNIKIKEYSSSSPTADIDNAILLGEKSFDMVYAAAPDVALLLSGGKLVDLADFSAFDLSREFFDAAAVNGLSIKGKTYAVAGDLTTGTTYATSALLVNNAIMNKIDASKILGASPYELAEEGKWTLDAMMQLSLAATTEGEVKDSDPLFTGFSSPGRSAISLLAGLGASLFDRGADGLPTVAVGTRDFSELAHKISSLDWTEREKEAGELFGSCYNMGIKQGEALFTLSTLGEAKEYADRGLCFSLLPVPKLDPAMPEYISRVQLDRCELAAIPSTTSDLARSAAVLTSLFSDSNNTKKAYLSSLQTDCPHDVEKMVTLIEGTKHYDAGDLFGWGDFGGALSLVLTATEPISLEETLTPRVLASEKALDIVLKRLLGENYREDIQ